MKALKKSNVPIRTCVMCRGRFPKSDLLRIVFNGELTFDVKQDCLGRGSYVCSKEQCIGSLADAKAFQRAFRLRGLQDKEISNLIDSIKEHFSLQL